MFDWAGVKDKVRKPLRKSFLLAMWCFLRTHWWLELFFLASPLDSFIPTRHLLKCRIICNSSRPVSLLSSSITLNRNAPFDDMLFLCKGPTNTKRKGLGGGWGLRRRLRDIIVRDELFDVRQFLVEILAALLLFPVAWESLQRKDRTIYMKFKTLYRFLNKYSLL